MGRTSTAMGCRGSGAGMAGRRIGYRAGGLAVVMLALMLAACAPREIQTGFLPDEDRVGEIKTGVHDRDSIAQLLGSPTSVATFEDRTWYYISRRSEKLAFLDAKTLDQQVIAIHFDDSGIVKNVTRYSMEDGRVIDPVSRTTRTRGRELGFLEQVFGNLGRFNTDESPLGF